MSDYMGHREEVGLRKLGHPQGLQWYRWESIGDAVKLTGCVVTRTYSKGPRKGRPVFDGPKLVAIVTDAEMADQEARFERETGKCGWCCGRGDVFHSWNHLTGTARKPCHKCEGTGVRR